MAKETLVRIVDDLDGSVLEEGGSTVEFALEGKSYEIDLSDDNLEKFRRALAPFIEAGRPVRANGSVQKTNRSRGSARGPLQTPVREWARSNGYDVGVRGRIPADVLAAYRAAN